jgi:DSF synthase
MRGRSGPLRNPEGDGRLAASSSSGHATERAASSPASSGAAVERLPDARARRIYDSWLRTVSEFDELEVIADMPEGVLWCYMAPRDRPSVTPGLARQSRDFQRSVKQLFEDLGPSDLRPFRYLIWGSRIPGVFNLGGDLRLFGRLVRNKDRHALRDYAINCIDVVFANAMSLDLPIITISMVEGDALGGGFEAAISSDIIVAERTARFGLPEVLFNLFPGMGAYSLIARRLNSIQAERMILSGRVYAAEELHELGLVEILVEPGEGRHTINDLIARNGGRHAAQCAVYRAGRRVNPLPYKELYDIALMWVDTVLGLSMSDLKKMERLAAAQDRRRPVSNPRT